jgi:P27 family predicted phage terminase small subunit
MPTGDKPPRPPTHLKGVARKFFREQAAMLWPAGLLTVLDVPILAGAAVQYAIWRDAVDQLEKHGQVIRHPKGWPMLNPYVKIAEKAFNAWNKALIEFGMSPSARNRVKVAKPEQKDPFEAFLSKPDEPEDENERPVH